MKKFYWMIAAILTISGTMALTSCSDKDDDSNNGSEGGGGGEEQVEAWIYDQHMDKSILPGDNFYMYCNGGYWNRTQVSTENDQDQKGYQEDEYKLYEARYKQDITYPTMDRLAQSIVMTDENARAAADELIQNACDRLDAVETSEEFWEVVGQLWKEGYKVDFDLSLFSRDGKMVVTMSVGEDNDDEYDIDGSGDYDYAYNVKRRLLQDPTLQAAMVPLAGRTTRASISGVSEWPMLITLYKALGIDPEVAYMGRTDLEDENVVKLAQAFQQLQDLADQNLEQVIEETKKTIREDLFVCSDDYIQEIMASGSTLLYSRFGKFFTYEVSKQYADKTITPQLKSRMLTSLEELREAFRDRLSKSVWMSEASKTVMIDKLNKMTFYAGKPDEWIDVEPDFTGSTCALDDLMRIRKARLETQKKMIGMEKEKAAFHVVAGFLGEKVTLDILNANYMNNFNALFIFPAWLLEPLYSDKNEDAVNYAALVVAAHEITHGFDAKGVRFEADGDQVEGSILKDPADAQKFQSLTQLLVECYSAFEVLPDELPGLHNDGAFTLNENIADLGGFEIAYSAFVKHMEDKGGSGDELTKQKRHFYQAYANLWRSKYTPYFAQENTNGKDRDNHSLDKERINGVVSNTDAWYDLFNVKEGQKLYLPLNKRAHIW